MGAEQFTLIHGQIFTPSAIKFKQFLAERLTPVYTDVRDQLACIVDPCPADTDKLAALDAAIAEMAPFLPSGGGGGGGS